MQLYPQQQEALDKIKAFIQDKDESVFILKGYAGTGKTTMVKALLAEFSSMGKSISLMAPTGRAAKVLRDKTGYGACTIHRGIYAFGKMQAVRHDELGKLIETNQTKDADIRSKDSDDLQFWFGIKQHEPDDDPSKNVYIIDESSMISSRPANSETLHFGTDVLIDDLLTYVQPHLGGKIVFVGDPAQLPPVGDNRSVALDESYFEGLKLGVSSFELTEVIRQSGDSVILKNAIKIRDLQKAEHRNELCFERKEDEVVDITSEEVVESYFEHNPHPSFGDSVIVCYTNALAYEYNQALRRRYFPDCKEVQPGDILQVVRNNTNTCLGIEVFNGDFVRVLEVSSEIEQLSAPVWTDISGKKERVTITIGFRTATLMSDSGSQFRCKIVDSLLNSNAPTLTPLESVALYVNFRMRHPNLKENEEAFKEAIMNDPYFNAVQVKYGYAITGHKSQGGEWKTAYVDYSGRTGLNMDCLRWAYTATTRAGEVLFGVNMPNITPMSTLVFNSIMRISKPSKEAFSYADIDGVDALPATAQAFQKQKYISVKRQLDDIGLVLKSVQCCQYDDKYFIETPNGSVTVDCWYNSVGIYTRYALSASLPENEQIFFILNNDEGMQFAVDYQPSDEAFARLFNKMKSVCDSLEVQITNIVENLRQYYICYYLKTSGKFAQIQFYFKGNHALTHAMPSSDLGQDDILLNQIIANLK